MKSSMKRIFRLLRSTPVRHIELHSRAGVTYALSSRESNRRILFCSLPDAIYKGLQETPQAFSNQGLALEFYKVLQSMGYEVDAIQWDAKLVPADIAAREYDAVILHGGVSTGALVDTFGEQQRYLYFATGSYWKFHNAAEQDRLKKFNQRHDTNLKPDRLIESSEERALDISDAIIVLGNKTTKNTYRKFSNVYSLECATYNNPKLRKDLFKYKDPKNVLFFSGNGNIHKGLDLLIEACLELKEINLHVCTGLEESFLEVYGEKLRQAINIHIHGFTAQNSKQFARLMKECAYICLPSCSEGSPGSVVDCMAYGLIPIVTSSAGISVEHGYTLNDATVDELKKNLLHASSISKDQLTANSRDVTKRVSESYSPDVFRMRLQDIFEEVL